MLAAEQKVGSIEIRVYALAAEEVLLADQQAEALAAGYWSIRGKGFESGALQLRTAEADSLQTSTQGSQLREQVAETLRELITGLRRGEFPVYNSDEHCTGRCDYRTICRIGQIRSLEKSWPLPEEPSA